MAKDLLYTEMPYSIIDAHWDNRFNWDDYQVCKYIAINIPGTEVSCSLDKKIERFLINWKIEEKIRNLLDLQYYDDTHSCFHTGQGLPIPDFKNADNITYELKTTKKYKYNDKHWWNADIHLYYNVKTNKLYQQLHNNSYIEIGGQIND